MAAQAFRRSPQECGESHGDTKCVSCALLSPFYSIKGPSMWDDTLYGQDKFLLSQPSLGTPEDTLRVDKINHYHLSKGI